MTSDVYSVENGEIHTNLHPGQWKTLQCDRRFILMLAGTQSGKTVFGPIWLYDEIMECGPGDYLVVSPSFPLLALKALPAFKQYFETDLGVGRYIGSPVKRFEFSESGSRRTFGEDWSGTPTVVYFGHAQDPDSLESATAKAAWLDECGQDKFRLASWEAIQRRLALHQGRALLTTTPYNLGWLKKQFYDKWKAGNKNYAVIQFESIANPAFPQEEFDRAKDELPGWKFRMFYKAIFTRPAGMIYGDYDEKVHKVAPFPIPKEWPRMVGLDFGAVNTALVYLAEDVERSAYYLYRESLSGGKTTAEHANDAKEHTGHERVTTWAGGSKSEGQQRMDWRAAGVNVQDPVIVDVEAGIDRVIALLKHKRLFIFDICVKVLDEIGTYSRVVDENGQPTEKIKDKETFHLLDAIRYIVQHFGFPSGGELVDFV